MISARAYAKLNLSLRVGPRRPDGFHELDSIVQTIELADRISFVQGGTGLRVESPFPPREDLVYRAAQAILAEKRAKVGVRITVEKNIPTGAGLGGGSSDAACVLVLLDRLIPPRLRSDRLAELAAAIGADVPLFLRGGRVRMQGKGERLTFIPPGAEGAFLLVIPPIHCDTAAVYRRYDEIHPGGKDSPPRLGENDLEEAALSLYPDLAPYPAATASAGGDYWGMSGSGATFFAAFADPDRARAAGEYLRHTLPEARIEVCAPTEVGCKEQEVG